MNIPEYLEKRKEPTSKNYTLLKGLLKEYRQNQKNLPLVIRAFEKLSNDLYWLPMQHPDISKYSIPNNKTFKECIKALRGQEDTNRIAEVYGKFGHVIFWNTSLVTDMSYAFKDFTTFNQPIGGWSTSQVTTIRGMFEGCDDFNQELHWYLPGRSDGGEKRSTIIHNQADSIGFKMPYMAVPPNVSQMFSLTLSKQHNPYEIKNQVEFVIRNALKHFENNFDSASSYILYGEPPIEKKVTNYGNEPVWGGIQEASHRLTEEARRKYIKCFLDRQSYEEFEKLGNQYQHFDALRESVKKKIKALGSKFLIHNNAESHNKFSALVKNITYTNAIKSAFGYRINNDKCRKLIKAIEGMHNPSKQQLKTIKRYCKKENYENAVKSYISKPYTKRVLDYNNYRKLYNNSKNKNFKKSLLNHSKYTQQQGTIGKMKKMFRTMRGVKNNSFNSRKQEFEQQEQWKQMKQNKHLGIFKQRRHRDEQFSQQSNKPWVQNRLRNNRLPNYDARLKAWSETQNWGDKAPPKQYRELIEHLERNDNKINLDREDRTIKIHELLQNELNADAIARGHPRPPRFIHQKLSWMNVEK